MIPRDLGRGGTRLRGLLVSMLWWAGVGGAAMGANHLAALLSNGYTAVRLYDTLFNFAVGFLLYGCSRVLRRASWWAIPSFSAVVLAIVLYGLWIGRGFNWVFAGGGLAMLVALTVVWRRGELT